MLNSKIEKRNSTINGYGLFTKISIEKDEIIWHPTPETIDMIPLEKLSELSESKKQYWIDHSYLMNGILYIDTDDTIFMNHSCSPNVIDDGSVMRAARDISANEEVTWNYIPFINPHQRFECNCGSVNCVKIVPDGIIAVQANH